MFTFGQRHLRPAWLFLLLTSVIYSVALVIRSLLPGLDQGALVATGLTLDLVVVVPALYYFLLVRRQGWPGMSIVPVAVASFLLASRVVPGEFHDTLNRLHRMAAPLELLVLGFIAHKAVRVAKRVSRSRSARTLLPRGTGDALTAIREAARQTVGVPLAAEIAAFEIGVLYYALFSWHRSCGQTPNTFTGYRKTGYPLVLGVLLAVMGIEMIAVHLVVYRLWSPVAAWVLTGLSIYGALWMLGDLQALRLRPTIITAQALMLRTGFRWEVDISWSNVIGVRRLDWQERGDGEGRLNTAALGEPTLELVLREPVRVRGVYGLAKTTARIGVAVDEPERFAASARTMYSGTAREL
jgi:hypothetical protein